MKGHRLLSVLRKLSCTLPEQPESPVAVAQSGMLASSSAASSAAATRSLEDNLSDWPDTPEKRLSQAGLDFAQEDGEAALEQLQLMLKKEALYMPDGDWLVDQGEEFVLLRSRLVAWLRLASLYHQLSPITAEHALNFMDRFLQRTTTTMCGVGTPSDEEVRRMQLVAVACFSLAAKMNEVFIPGLDEVQVGVPWLRFELGPIQEMELEVLLQLNWRMACVTAGDLVQPLLAANSAWRQHCSGGTDTVMGASRSAQLAAEICDKARNTVTAALTDVQLARFKPSEAAAAALILGVYEVCPDGQANDIQAALLTRFPRASACVPTLLEHSTPLRSASAPRTARPAVLATPSPTSQGGSGAGDTPAAKRWRRAPTPTSILDL